MTTRYAAAALFLLLAASAQAGTYYRAEIPGGHVEASMGPCIAVDGREVPQYSRAEVVDRSTGKVAPGCWGRTYSGEWVMVFDGRGSFVFYPHEMRKLHK